MLHVTSSLAMALSTAAVMVADAVSRTRFGAESCTRTGGSTVISARAKASESAALCATTTALVGC